MMNVLQPRHLSPSVIFYSFAQYVLFKDANYVLELHNNIHLQTKSLIPKGAKSTLLTLEKKSISLFELILAPMGKWKYNTQCFVFACVIWIKIFIPQLATQLSNVLMLIIRFFMESGFSAFWKQALHMYCLLNSLLNCVITFLFLCNEFLYG